METLHRIWEGWKKVGQLIGDFIARVILTIFYVTLFAPFGLGVRLFADPLHAKPRPAAWLQHADTAPLMEEARRLG